MDGMPILFLTQPIRDSIHLRSYTDCFVDSNKTIKWQDVENQYFIPLSKVNESFKSNINSDCSNNRYWLRASLFHSSSDSITRLLQFSKLDSLDVYVLHDNHLIAHEQIGHWVSPQKHIQTGFVHSKFAIMITIPPNVEVVILAKGKKSYCLSPIEWILFNPVSEEHFLEPNLKWINAWNYIFFGILLFMMLNTLVFYIQNKELAFLNYCVDGAATVFAVLSSPSRSITRPTIANASPRFRPCKRSDS